MNTKTKKNLLCVCEAAIFIALASVLNLIKLNFNWLQGGSISLAMVPIFVFSLRRGPIWGIAAGLAFGLVDCTMDAGFKYGAISVFFDYLAAYAIIGSCGFFNKMRFGAVLGTLTGCLLRFVVHFISGVTIYKIYVVPLYGISLSPDNGLDVILYSLFYNGGYMIFNTVISVILIALLKKAAPAIIKPQE